MTNSEKKRTSQQNKSLHLYFGLVADALNAAGLDIHVVLQPGMDIRWSPETVKELLWRTIQRVQLGKESTTQLTTKEIDQVYDTLNAHLSKLGIEQAFPSIEEITERMGEKLKELVPNDMCESCTEDECRKKGVGYYYEHDFAPDDRRDVKCECDCHLDDNHE